jgi:hypothetical protein
MRRIAGHDVRIVTPPLFIATEVRALLDNPDFTEALPGFLLPDAGSQARRGFLEERLRALCG